MENYYYNSGDGFAAYTHSLVSLVFIIGFIHFMFLYFSLPFINTFVMHVSYSATTVFDKNKKKNIYTVAYSLV